MTLNELQARLLRNFSPRVTAGLDAAFCLAIGTERLTFRIVEETLEFSDLEAGSCDATFHFEDVDGADALLSGRQDVLSAFMGGQFSSDGYLIWAFVLMAMFRNTAVQ
ncbi:MAG: hypothetical protein O7G86_07685 [Gammaproteobacteria bacterium]|nr:hypothetical protein [Gammaproteobacteria bacterium]